MKIASALLICLFVAFVIACTGAATEEATNQKTEKASAAKTEREQWAEPGTAVRQGVVRVSVSKVSVGKVALKNLGQESESKDALLKIELKIENLSDAKKTTYKSWGSRFTDFSSEERARLTDNLGNKYTNSHFGFGATVVGQLKTESIYPVKSVTDVLVFEAPVQKATILKLELPASAFGGTGMLRMKIKVP
ncbi:MAG: hypothetical protein ACE5KM_05335 [Planctomycetaceae bacterium]